MVTFNGYVTVVAVVGCCSADDVTLATLRNSLTSVTGHCICCHDIGVINSFDADEYANNTPNSLSAVDKKNERESPNDNTRAFTISPILPHYYISTNR